MFVYVMNASILYRSVREMKPHKQMLATAVGCAQDDGTKVGVSQTNKHRAREKRQIAVKSIMGDGKFIFEYEK